MKSAAFAEALPPLRVSNGSEVPGSRLVRAYCHPAGSVPVASTGLHGSCPHTHTRHCRPQLAVSPLPVAHARTVRAVEAGSSSLASSEISISPAASEKCGRTFCPEPLAALWVRLAAQLNMDSNVGMLKMSREKTSKEKMSMDKTSVK